MPAPDIPCGDPDPAQLHQNMGSPQQNLPEDLPYQQGLGESECEGHKVEDVATASQTQRFLPYSDIMIPVMWSTMIDHSASSSLQRDEWDSTSWEGYYEAIALLKTGLNRQALGLPEASKSAGSLFTIEDVDMYFNVVNKIIYVASELGLITVPDYLNMCEIALERRVRFNGKIPKWAMTIFDAADKRYVAEVFDKDPLPLRSEVHVFDTFESNQEPVGLWGCVYSVETRKILQFPMIYTSEERLDLFSLPSLKHFFGVPEKQSSPQEPGESLFEQTQDFLDDYLKDCGHPYDRHESTDSQDKESAVDLHQREAMSSPDLEGLILPKMEGSVSARSDEGSESQLQETVTKHGIEMSYLPEVLGVESLPLVPVLPISKTNQQDASTKQHPGIQAASESRSGSPTQSTEVATFSVASAASSRKRKSLTGSSPSTKKPKIDVVDKPVDTSRTDDGTQAADVRAEDYPHFDAPAVDLITDQTRFSESLASENTLGNKICDQADQLSESSNVVVVAESDAGLGEGATPEVSGAPSHQETDDFDIYIPSYAEHMEELRRRR